MKIIKETSRKVVTIDGYDGICDGCGSPISYDSKLIVVVIEDNDKFVLLVPVDRLVCPYCLKEIITIRLWKNMNVTEEFKGLK